MKEFDLKEYLANPEMKVVTRGGAVVEISTTDGREPYPIVGYIGDGNMPVCWHGDGVFLDDGRILHPNDLFFADKESEDERIREQLYRYFCQLQFMSDKEFSPLSVDEILSWLEKQKEQKPDRYNEGFLEGVEQGREWERARIRLEQKPAQQSEGEDIDNKVNNFFDAIGDCGYTQEEILHLKSLWKEAGLTLPEPKQKPGKDSDYRKAYHDGWNAHNLEIAREQKPAGPQDYSNLTDLERAIHRGFLCAGVDNVPVTIIKETAQDCFAQIKPAEWSEEDEKIRRNLMSLLSCMRGDRITEETYQKYYPWLKSLRPQPKQEWSEEDENAIKYLHELISFGYSEKFMDAQTACDMRAWLNKSLRPQPHWKPSEKQINRLLSIIAEMRDIGHSDIADFLASLYGQLKKLMEE